MEPIGLSIQEGIINHEQEISKMVERYADAIGSQDKDDFCGLWANSPHCVLISIASEYTGVESIYQDFLIGRIQAAYSQIKLVAETVEVHEVSDDLATVVFRYHTECIRRDSGEPYGIQGLETQVFVREDGGWRLLHVHYSK